ncbi:GMC family oxidoreductase [Streptomyces sp. RFCAC02]|uniref:GMC family oxidoreductase n=1 Tax=Streptomyces sp. RFCAC02 TaxID=2499143 RepID=UPI00101E8DDB|nr:GMC family oxidoreductase [Streptomyces sp. RFCAC02]
MSGSEAGGVVRSGEARLRALVEAVVPADDRPSAVEAGGLGFLARVLAQRPDWEPRVARVLERVGAGAEERYGRPFEDPELGAADRAAVLDGLLGDADYVWFAQLVNGGHYADEGNGGNAGNASWDAVGWRPGLPPAAAGDGHRDAVVTPDGLAARYDVVVVGSGAGGGAAACRLAEAGRSVLVVEAGSWPATGDLARDHLRNPRAYWDLGSLAGPGDEGNPRVLATDGGRVVLRPSDGRWSNNAMTLGGGTRVYGAQAWRFGPDDFRMASRYGVPEGSTLADWPFGYEELAPYYEQAEWEIGVSGGPDDGPYAGRRARPLPMPPLPTGRAYDVLRAGAGKLGLSTVDTPLLVNSVPYLGRPACAQCSLCVGFACTVDAKNGSHNTLLARAFASGNCRVLLEATAARLLTSPGGRITGVAVTGLRDGRQWHAEVAAGEVVLAAGAVETARLLLNSAHDAEPHGVGNNADQVGRHLQGHLYASATGVFDDPVEDLIGPGPSIATADHRQDNAGIVGGGIVVKEFVPTPASTYRNLVDAGLIPVHGLAAKRGMRELAPRTMRLAGPVQEVTTAGARVRVDPGTRDRLGLPVAVLSGAPHAEDLRAQAFLAERCAEWLTASGARRVVTSRPSGTGHGPSAGQHQAGTCRMGTDPARSVTDPFGRVWGHDNLRVADGSLHVTNGGVNPVLSIFANALRVAAHMTAS